jgi:hypothetical protein
MDDSMLVHIAIFINHNHLLEHSLSYIEIVGYIN